MLAGLTKGHQFRFTRDKDGHVICAAKEYSDDFILDSNNPSILSGKWYHPHAPIILPRMALDEFECFLNGTLSDLI